MPKRLRSSKDGGEMVEPLWIDATFTRNTESSLASRLDWDRIGFGSDSIESEPNWIGTDLFPLDSTQLNSTSTDLRNPTTLSTHTQSNKTRLRLDRTPLDGSQAKPTTTRTTSVEKPNSVRRNSVAILGNPPSRRLRHRQRPMLLCQCVLERNEKHYYP